MLSMIVNDGIIYKPHLLKEVRNQETNTVSFSNSPEILWKSSIAKETFDQTKENLRSVMLEGTARYPLANKVVQIAGKTGTAEVGLSDRWHSWFVGYAPYNYTNIDDVIVVVVMVEAANVWEWWAPYATNIIFQGYFANQLYEDAIRELKLTTTVRVQAGRIE